MRNISSTDSFQIQRSLLIFFLCLISIFFGYYGIVHNMPVVGFLIPIIGLVCLLFSRPYYLLYMALFCMNASVIIPGLPKFLGALQMIQALLIGWMLATEAMRKKERGRQIFPMDFWLMLFVANLILTLFVRGAGFALLGSSTFGGSAYLVLILGLVAYFPLIRMKLHGDQAKVLMWGVLAGALVASVAQILIYIVPGVFGFLTKIIDTGAISLIEEKGRTDDAVVERWAAFGKLAFAILPFVFVFFRQKKMGLLLIGLCFFLVGMTGSRNRIFAMGFMVFFASVYYSKTRWQTVLFWCLSGMAGLAVLMVIAPVLPPAIQRAVSFIDFIPVDPEIAARAQKSTDWRLDMWTRYCIPNIPNYILIGRGLATDITGFAWLQAGWYGTNEFYYYMHRYHNGPLSLLLDTGLVGFISFTMFFALTVSRAWKMVRNYASKQDTILARYCIFLTLLISYEAVNYYFIFGALTPGTIFRILLLAAQLRILQKNLLAEAGSKLPELKGEMVTSFAEASTDKEGVSLKPENRRDAHRR